MGLWKIGGKKSNGKWESEGTKKHLIGAIDNQRLNSKINFLIKMVFDYVGIFIL